MAIFEQLKMNKGTVSSSLGKKLAHEVLQGKTEILKEAIALAAYCLKNKKEKNIRSGAAKIIECVAQENPGLVAPHLENLLPCLEADEPQTRWAIIRTFGFCAKDNPGIARKAIPFARKYIKKKRDGQLCLVSSADLFLGDYAELSKETTNEVFPILLESCDNVIANEADWLFESFIKIARHLSKKQREEVLAFAKEYEDFPRKSTLERVKILKEACRGEKEEGRKIFRPS
jgi:hypothetical protein